MTDIRDRELKPCPFCGGVAWHGVPTDGEGGVYCDRYAAGCSHCGFRLDVIEKDETAPFHQTKQEAIDKWNTRNATQERKDAAIEAEQIIAELERELKSLRDAFAGKYGIPWGTVKEVMNAVRLQDAIAEPLSHEQIRKDAIRHFWQAYDTDDSKTAGTVFSEMFPGEDL
jgi:Lar family restriction alleviation protein